MVIPELGMRLETNSDTLGPSWWRVTRDLYGREAFYYIGLLSGIMLALYLWAMCNNNAEVHILCEK